MILRFFVLVLFVSFWQFSHAQNLTGSWSGIMAGDEKLQVNMRMRGLELCGYTADYIISQPSSHCKANFKGWYDKTQHVWVLVGTTFIQNSGDHILMILRLWHQKGDPANTLRGTEEAKYGGSSIFGMGNDRGSVRIKRTSLATPPDMPDCFRSVKKPPIIPSEGKEVTVKTLPEKQDTAAKAIIPKKIMSVKQAVGISKKTTAKPVAPPKPIPLPVDVPAVVKADTLKEMIVPNNPSPINVDEPELVKKMMERKKTEFSHIIVHEKNITLSLYDNGIVDNDSVSVFYNGKLIAGKKRLSETPIIIHLELDLTAPLHEIVMFAENLGTIPPNTALIVVTAGNKRYELHSSSSLTENAVMTFEYQPN